MSHEPKWRERGQKEAGIENTLEDHRTSSFFFHSYIRQ